MELQDATPQLDRRMPRAYTGLARLCIIPARGYRTQGPAEGHPAATPRTLDSHPAPPAEPLPLKEAVRLGSHGGDRRSEKVDQPCNASLKYGTAAHWLARLHRDRPDLAARVEAKKLTANAAAIEAGFRRKPV